MTHTDVCFFEDERQMVLLALAELAFARPGFEPFIAGIAAKLDPGLNMYRAFLHNLDPQPDFTPANAPRHETPQEKPSD